MKIYWTGVILLFLLACFTEGRSQNKIAGRDSIVYNIIYRDTIVYRYDTVRIRHFVQTDTVWAPLAGAIPVPKRKGWYNPTSWGIGPMLGAYYSPFHGFDVNIGFGIQYYLFAVPSFRNPHMGYRKKTK